MTSVIALFLMLFNLLFISPQEAMSGILVGGGYVSEVSNGFVGNNDPDSDNSDSSGLGSNEIGFSLFTASTSGTISYMHGQLLGVTTSGRMAIYDSSLNLLAQTGDLSWDNGNQVNAALLTPIQITSGVQYYLAAAVGTDSFWQFDGKSGGTLYEDTDGWAGAGTSMPNPIVNDRTEDSNFTPRIWADNRAS